MSCIHCGAVTHFHCKRCGGYRIDGVDLCAEIADDRAQALEPSIFKLGVISAELLTETATAFVASAMVCQREAQRLYEMQRSATDPAIADLLERRGNTADACGAMILALVAEARAPMFAKVERLRAIANEIGDVVRDFRDLRRLGQAASVPKVPPQQGPADG